ncbi:hypothetical protein [Tateyamaria sp. ANG-S1]|uniref:hypothetical protein n=1 Tax=Tateyamaria sp. ANG-S1 TaxID=1577905 RepID=UPI00057CEAAB|nr:hypothetical protein [Tateyamaria sp. ANG-S1]KIC44868.1 hypothetical protein RA29_21560 [Tateyamaria sp. ANG-S1]
MAQSDEPKTFGDQLCRLAAETGLPTVLITGGREIEGLKALDAPQGQIETPMLTQEMMQSSATYAKYEVLLARMGINPPDLLCITDEDPQVLSRLGLRTCRFDEAVDKLRTYSLQFRQGVLSGSIPVMPEIVHTTLVPLDFDLGSMADPHDILEHGYRVFDLVLMCDTFVPLAGFKAKSLMKLVTGFAPVIHAQSDRAEGEVYDYATRLETLWNTGCRRTIFVSLSGQADVSAHMFMDLARSFGFDVQLLSWRQLIKVSVAVGYA